MTSIPKRKCIGLLMTPLTLPMTCKEEYKRLTIKAMTTPTRPVIMARMRRENRTTAVLLGRPEHAPAPFVPLFRSDALALVGQLAIE
jgi:hypothetical protein